METIFLLKEAMDKRKATTTTLAKARKNWLENRIESFLCKYLDNINA
jgi:hypothetical protein